MEENKGSRRVSCYSWIFRVFFYLNGMPLWEGKKGVRKGGKIVMVW